MAENSAIAWTDHSFNPWRGCTKVSAGCARCYAETLTKRWGKSLWGPTAPRLVTSAAYWKQPVKWNREAQVKGVRRRVFCGSMCDVFEDHPTANETRPRLWDLIASTPHLDWLLLTKRPENISALRPRPAGWKSMMPEMWGNGWHNVWLGTSIEDMRVSSRAVDLRAVSARVRFISYEPALGPLDGMDLDGIHWVIYGGESGPGHREDNPEWARSMRDRCKSAGVSFFFKQRSGARPATEPTLDGEKIEEFPARRQKGAT